MTKNALGKGLGALLSENNLAENDIGTAAKGLSHSFDLTGSAGENIIEITLDSIKPNPYQPRKDFDQDALEELAESIREHGVIEPIVVTPNPDGGYFIVGGERRTRAGQLAGLRKIPAVVKNYSQQKMLEIALIENIQRENLNALEEAQAYQQLMEMSGLNQEEVAKRVGKNRSTVANSLRLLKLPEDMQRALSEGKISAGHARAILSVDESSDQQILFARIVGNGMSVREAERSAQEMNGAQGTGSSKSKSSSTAPGNPARDPDLANFEQKLIEKFGTKVAIKGSLDKGAITLEYFSSEDLDRLYALLIN